MLFGIIICTYLIVVCWYYYQYRRDIVKLNKTNYLNNRIFSAKQNYNKIKEYFMRDDHLDYFLFNLFNTNKLNKKAITDFLIYLVYADVSLGLSRGDLFCGIILSAL